MSDFKDAQIRSHDTSIFTILTAMSQADKAAFLELQNIIGSLYPGYSYLEVGSDQGGSLIGPLFDSRCGALVSVDLRPPMQPDERGRTFDFPDNSTGRMLEILAKNGVSKTALARLRCFDTDLEQLPFWRVGQRARLAFIDAEHTNQAVFRDWLNVSRFMAADSIVAFHDANLIFDALENIQAMLKHQAICFSAHYLPSSMFVIGTGTMAEECSRAFQTSALNAADFIAISKEALQVEIAYSLSLKNSR
jgi:Methyltransferase domain